MSKDKELAELEERAYASGGLLGGWLFPHRIGLPVGPVHDDLGRAWEIPSDKAGLQHLLNEYIHRHGAPAKCVDEVSSRQGKLNDLRVLIMRRVEGEPINLAARALQLGPMKPIRRKVPPGPSYPPDAQDRVWAWDDRRDAETTAEVRREAGRLRSLGYTD